MAEERLNLPEPPMCDGNGECFRLEAEVARLREERDRLLAVIAWALGEEGLFPGLPSDWPKRKFYWRRELRQRRDAILSGTAEAGR